MCHLPSLIAISFSILQKEKSNVKIGMGMIDQESEIPFQPLKSNFGDNFFLSLLRRDKHLHMRRRLVFRKNLK